MLKPSDYDILERILHSTEKTAKLIGGATFVIDGEETFHPAARLRMVYALDTLDIEGSIETVEVSRTGLTLMRNKDHEAAVLYAI